MRKITLLFLALMIVSSVRAQDVPEVQQSLITKVTATWCIHCGTWGWNFFANVLEDNNSKAIIWASHYSGNLNNATSNAISSNLNVPGQPVFVLNNTNQGVGSSSVDTKRTAIQNAVNANAEMSPVANAGMLASLEGTELTVKTKAKFFQEGDGNYFLSVYLIEDGVSAAQTGQGSGAVPHKQILRAAMTTDVFGIELADGAVTSGTEFDETFTMTLDPTWDATKIEVAAIIWKKNGNTYEFVNGNSTTDLDATIVSTHDLANAGNSLQVRSDRTAAGTEILLDLRQDFTQSQLVCYSSNGQQMEVLASGALSAGTHTFQFNNPSALAPGIYFIHLQTNKGTMVEKLLVQ